MITVLFFPSSLPDEFIIGHPFLRYLQWIRGYHGDLWLPGQARVLLAAAILHAEQRLFGRFLFEEF